MSRWEGGIQGRWNQQLHHRMDGKGTDAAHQGLEQHITADKVQHQSAGHRRAVLPLCSKQKQHRRQDDPQFPVISGPADGRKHNIQKAAAQMRLYPIEDRQFNRLHEDLPPRGGLSAMLYDIIS